MDFQQLIVLGIFVGTILCLIFSNQRPSTIFAFSVLLLLGSGQIAIDDVLHNLTNKGLITLVLLLLVSNALDKTALLKSLGRKLVVANYGKSFWRLFGITFFSSALLNNTAIVASLIGPVKQNQYHASSRLLIPLSYAAILGGTVTLVGTSTNLIVDSFLVEQGHPGFKFWDFTLFGLSAGLICGLLIYILSPFLPNVTDTQNVFKEYFVETEVSPECELVGKSVEQNHLRNLPELFLVEVVRQGNLISPVTPEFVIQAGDKLIFSGNIEKLDSLSHIKGLTIFADVDGLMRNNLTEVIVSNRAQIIGQTLKALGFRALFDAAVVAIRRDGEQLSGKLGEIKLKAGDFLLLATGPDFLSRHNLSKNFFIISEQKAPQKLMAYQEWLAMGGFLIVMALAATDTLNLALGLMYLCAVLVLCKVSSNAEIKRHIPLNLIIVIVGALSLASAMQNSGLIASILSWLSPFILDSDGLTALIIIYCVTLLLTEFVTNNAAAALMFPFAYAVTQSMSLPVLPFALAVAFAASASFISPYGYQTNLMVYNATKYRFVDFVKCGLPISLLYSTIVLGLLHRMYL